MKTGKNLVELAQELTRQKDARRDFIADTRQIEAITDVSTRQTDVGLIIPNGGTFHVNDHAHRQIAQRLQIPQKYYDRMHSENAGLLIANINSWFQQKPERRMVRTLDGRARAFLSDKYRRIDNLDIAEAVLPVLHDMPDVKIESCELTETRMYIKALFPRIQGEVARGDVVQAGVVISNSEIGLGAVKVEPLVFRLVCLNGMIAGDHGVRKYHVGRNADGGEGDAAFEIFRDETMIADDRALVMKLQDVTKAAASEAKFKMIVQRMTEATTVGINGNPVKAVEVLSDRLSLNETEKGSVLRHLIAGGDLTKWGFVNALTRTSQDIADYDRATEFERMGGTVLDLNPNEWQAVAKAA